MARSATQAGIGRPRAPSARTDLAPAAHVPVARITAPFADLLGGRWQWAAVFLFVSILYLAFLGGRSHLDGHETLVAQTAREMWQSGDWFLPTFSGVPRYQKPPLAYWLAAGTFSLTGQATAATARLPFALSAIFLTLLLARVSGSWFGREVGWSAGLVQGTMAWSLLYGKSALIDITLTLLVSIAILSSTLDRWTNRPGLAPWIFWISSGFAVLAKGPVAIPVIFLPVVIYRLLRKRHLADTRFHTHPSSLAGLILFLFLSLAWPVGIYLQDPMVLELWYGQSVERFLEHWGPNTRPWFFYLYQIPLLTLPWSPIWILELASRTRRSFSPQEDGSRGVARDEYRLLWLWFGVAVLFFSISEGKREHYILPALPPLSVLTAIGLARWGALWREGIERHHRLLTGTLLATATCLGVAALGAGISLHPIGYVFVPIVALGAATIYAAATWNRFPASHGAASLLFLSLAVSVLAIEGGIAPLLQKRGSSLELFERNRPAIAGSDRIIQFGSNDRWAIFPLDRPMRWPRTPDELMVEVETAERPLLLVREKKLAEVRSLLSVELLDMTQPEVTERNPDDNFVLLRPIGRL